MVLIVHGLFTNRRDCLVVGCFKIVFNVKSLSRRLTMRFVVFSSCIVFHVGCRFVPGHTCAVAMFLNCSFFVWMGGAGFNVIALVVVITAMVSLMIL